MIDRELLRQVLLEQAEFTVPADFILREIIPTLTPLMSLPSIVIIMGVRRCGKSTLLHWVRLQSAEKDYYINFDDDRLVDFSLADFQTLYELMIEMWGKQTTFFFDEIQLIPEWERFVRRLHDHGNKIYITGSNAIMFSSELGTRLTGRYLSVTMFPYGFKEYIQYKSPDLGPYQPTSEITANYRRLFTEFLTEGGFPEYVKYLAPDYLHTLFENIVYKDIIVRYKLPHERIIRSLLHFLASNIAKNITFNALRKPLGLSNSNTVAEYCHYFQNSFLCFMINKYSPSLKQQYGYAKKIYWIDLALAQKIGFRISEDRGRMLENAVYLELLRRGKEIYFYQEKKECDFIIKFEHRIIAAIQVTVSLNDPKTREREIAGLIEALKAFGLTQGIIITENENDTITYEEEGQLFSIIVMPIWRWLIEPHLQNA
ncbi:MAG: ATP-binding protein [Gammaproteobacteria bacterium]